MVFQNLSNSNKEKINMKYSSWFVIELSLFFGTEKVNEIMKKLGVF